MKSNARWKQICSLFLAVCMVVTMMPLTAFAAVDEKFTVEKFKYKVLTESTSDSTGTLVLTGFEGEPTGELTVTDAVYKDDVGINYIVTEIGQSAFEGASITSVSIPDSVTTIGQKAFAQCDKLGKVNFGPNSLLETIGDYAFTECTFTEFSIPNTVTSIGDNAFGYCNNLREISISKNVDSLGDKPFYVNHALELINIDGHNPNYSSENGVLYNKSGDSLLRYPANKSDTEFSIPDGVTSLAESSFYANNKLEKLTIPSTVSEIEKGVFYWAQVLEDIRFLGDTPPTVEKGDTFNRTDKLSNIYVPVGKVDAYKSALSSVLSSVGKDINIIKEYTIPGAIEVTTAEALKNALENTSPQTILVTTDINMASSITVGADHILIIDDGKTISTGEMEFTIPVGKTLTVKGPGILKANKVNPESSFVSVYGGLKLMEGSSLETSNYANIYIDGGKIESLGSSISILNNTDTTFTAITMQTGGSMSMEDSFLNIDIGTNNVDHQVYGLTGGSLDLNKCQVNIKANGSGSGIYSTLNAKDTTIIIENEEYSSGISTYADSDSFIVENSDITIKNSGTYGIDMKSGNTVFKDSRINVENTGGTAIRQTDGTKMTLDKSSITITDSGGRGLDIQNGSIVEGENGGKFIFEKNAKLYNVGLLFNDRGYTLTYKYEIDVEDESTFPSINTLTAGQYIWNDEEEVFEKEGTVNWDEGYGLVIAGVKVDENNASNITGTDIQGKVSYDVSNKTLTLDNAKIATNLDLKYEYAIYSSNDIRVKLEGDSTIGYNNEFVSAYNILHGIYANEKNIELVGSGNLNIYDQYMGIIGKNITVNSTGNIYIMEKGGGMACCFKAHGGTLTINSGNLELSSIDSNGLYGDNIVINGGTITAQSYNYSSAFNKAPIFGSNYSYTLKVGSDEFDAKETTNPTFTEKYINIKPKTSGGGNNGGGNTGGGSGGSGGGGGGASDTPTKVEYTTSNGEASLSMNNSKINEIITKAKGGEAVLDLKSARNTQAVMIPKNALSSFEKADLDLVVKLPEGNATIDNKALASILEQFAGSDDMKLELTQISSSNLSAAQQESVKSGDLVFDISILMGTKNITEFDGELNIEIPYKGELPVAVWYLNDKGELEKIESSYKNGVVSFVLNHLSLYLVGEDESKEETEVKWNNPFLDIKEDSWFYEAVKYVYENGLMKGISDNAFKPNEVTTRGMIVTILHRLEGSSSAGASPFSDVEGDKYYRNAVAWASENKIVSGYGNDKFGPEDAITREQLAVILMNYAKYKDYDINAKADLSKYEDSKNISNWAIDAISWANATGLIEGSDNSLAPSAKATRAHVATILNRLVEDIVK